MFDVVGISLHPLRWQWAATRLAVWGLVSAVSLFMTATITAVFLMVSPFDSPSSLEVIVWAPFMAATLLAQLSLLLVQILGSTMLVTTTPNGMRNNRSKGWKQQTCAVLGIREVQMTITVYAGLAVGISLMKYAPNAAVLMGALLPFAFSLSALRGLLDSIRESRQPAKAAAEGAYSAVVRRGNKYGLFWIDPDEIRTAEAAYAWASMAGQQRINIFVLNVLSVASAATLNGTRPPTEPLEIMRLALLIAAAGVALESVSRYGRLRDFQDKYYDRAEELDGRA